MLTRISNSLARRAADKAFDEGELQLINACRPYTMVSAERLMAMVDAARYVSKAGIPGAIVECGVWRGGVVAAAARTLLAKNDIRDLYLFDTFEGMSEPTEADVSTGGHKAIDIFRKTKNWCAADISDVQAVLAQTGYPSDRVHFVKGLVEQTIPTHAPEAIAVLRLDTDWYESTKHEMEDLWPRLAKGGVLLVDDYGKWQGSRKAIDEYLSSQGVHLLLSRTDQPGRAAVKP